MPSQGAEGFAAQRLAEAVSLVQCETRTRGQVAERGLTDDGLPRGCYLNIYCLPSLLQVHNRGQWCADELTFTPPVYELELRTGEGGSVTS